MIAGERQREPRFLSKAVAVREIVDALSDQAGEFPFILIAGAGISAPAVPLAAGLVARCEERCRERGTPPEELPTAVTDPLDRYAAWFEAAYPQRDGRRDFFIKLVEAAPLSPAVLRLAHDSMHGAVIVICDRYDRLDERAPLACVPYEHAYRPIDSPLSLAYAPAQQYSCCVPAWLAPRPLCREHEGTAHPAARVQASALSAINRRGLLL